MSKYREIKTEFRDETLLAQALKALGIPYEHHVEPVHLYGIGDHRRPETAHYIIHRDYIGRASNDIGYRVEPNGHVTAIISDFDSVFGQGPELARRITQEYARAFVHREAQRRGYRVHETRDAAGNIQIQLRSAR